MPSAFGTKILRLLLLFAMVPSILLAVAGYYLATETTGLSSGTTEDHFRKLADYYSHRTFSNIQTDIDNLAQDTSTQTTFIDFAWIKSYEQTTWLIRDTLLTSSLVSLVGDAATRKQDGFVETDNLVIQYSCREIEDSVFVCAGIVHGSGYTSMLSSYTSDRIARLSSLQLHSRYLLFLRILFATLAILSATLAYYFSSRISRSLSRPVTELAHAAEAIAGGDFNHSISTTATGELKILVESFNHMAAQLDTTTALLTQAERVAAWRHIARRFAHELKNSLQPIIISLYRIEKALSDTTAYDSVKESLLAVSDDLKHLTRLADRFSQLAKLPPPTLEKTDLVLLLQSVADLYSEQLNHYNFSIELPTKPIYSELDPTYFREVLHNLLKNAMEATPANGIIMLSLHQNDNEVQIVVRDFGKGFPDDIQKAARMPYFTTKSTGSGLGLAIVEKTVNELSGRLDIFSAPGKGTTITITLPKAYKGHHHA